MNRKTAIYVYASETNQETADAAATNAKITLKVEDRTVVGQRTPKGDENREFAKLETPDTYTLDLPPGTYRIESAEAVTIIEASGASSALVAVTNVTVKDDWPDPPKRFWSTDSERDKLRIFVVGELY
jgi:hypothetical protein